MYYEENIKRMIYTIFLHDPLHSYIQRTFFKKISDKQKHKDIFIIEGNGQPREIISTKC